MGNNQAWENLIEFFQTISWVWTNVEHVRDREACNVILIHSNDKFWRFGIKSILQTSWVQRIFLPRQNSSSLQFQAKAPAAAASVSLFPFTLTASAETAPGATLFSGSPCNPRWGVPTSAPGRTKIIIAIKQKLKGGAPFSFCLMAMMIFVLPETEIHPTW